MKRVGNEIANKVSTISRFPTQMLRVSCENPILNENSIEFHVKIKSNNLSTPQMSGEVFLFIKGAKKPLPQALD